MTVQHWPNRLGVNVGPENEIMICIGALRVTAAISSNQRRHLVINDPAITHATRSESIPDQRYRDAVTRCHRDGELVN